MREREAELIAVELRRHRRPVAALQTTGLLDLLQWEARPHLLQIPKRKRILRGGDCGGQRNGIEMV